jgi:hypothetical protein
VIASEHENMLRVHQIEEFDDPWWLMSVKETLALRTPKDHYDDGRSLTSSMKALEKQETYKTNAELRKQKIVDQLRAEKMEKLALAQQWGKLPRNPKSAWGKESKPNKYIDGHTKVFAKFNSVKLKADVASAMKLYIEAAVRDKKRILNEPEPEYRADKFAAIKVQLGGDDAMQAMAEKWEKLAAKAKKYLKPNVKVLTLISNCID